MAVFVGAWLGLPGRSWLAGSGWLCLAKPLQIVPILVNVVGGTFLFARCRAYDNGWDGVLAG